MSTADLIILAVIGVVLFFAVRAMIKAKKKGQCIGCPESGCSSCCNHCSYSSPDHQEK